MKKQLMTTTALVAAGVIASSGVALGASKPKLSLGGWFEGIVGIADQDENAVGNRVGLDVHQDSEVFFKGSVKLDNGISIKTRVELEGQSSNSGDQIDEAYMGIKGKFGEVRIGSEDNAAHLMTTGKMGSWATNVGQNLNFDVGDWIERPPGHRGSTVNRLDLGEGDSEKLTYFTPRFGGFQLGVSYMPSFNEGVNNTPELTTSANHTGYAIAARYDGKWDSVGIGAAVGYAAVNPAAGSDNQSDPKGLAAGLKLTFGKITIAGGYHREMNLGVDNNAGSGATVTNDGQTALDFGIKYDGGKNKFSLGYMTAEHKATVAAGDDEVQAAMLSYRRALGPGVQYRLNFIYGDWEGEDIGSADNNDGYAITTSVRLAF
ncbi:MAG: porin [Alphaproteobacteria bacterium]|nr:porin [Alphaproteobacteria bacterium]